MNWLKRFMGRGDQDWMCTASGIQYWPASPRACDVRIYDIAHHLSRLCRYTGAVLVEHYSVAEHSVHVSHTVPPELALEGLLHDAPEAYTNDLSRPLKRSLPDYKRIEARNWAVIAGVFGLSANLPPEVHEADIRVYLAERQSGIMPSVRIHDGYEGSLPPANVTIMALAPNAARELFLRRYYDITSGLHAAERSPVWPGRPRLNTSAVSA